LTDTQGQGHCKVKTMETVSGSNMAGVLLIHGSKHCKGTGTLNLTKQ
jgi:hypothetical protein